MKALKELLDERKALVVENRKLLDAAKGESRELTADETTAYETRDAAIDGLCSQIENRERTDARNAKLATIEASFDQPAGRQSDPSQPGGSPAGSARAAAEFQFRNRTVRFAHGTPEHARAASDYGRDFTNYIAHGQISNGLLTSSDPKGGYLAPMQWTMQLIKFLDDMVFMRKLATVLPPLTTGTSLGVPSWDTDPGDADWTAEVPAADIAEDDNATMGARELTPHLCTKLVKLGTKLIRAAAIDPDALVTSRLGYKFGITEEKAFISGSGVNRPLGVFTASADGVTTARDVTCASATVFVADELFDLLYTLKEGYQRNATWLVSREFIKRVRKLKDSQNQYLWQPGLQGGQPSLILDRPYVMSEYVPATYTTGLYVAVVGDFRQYWIVDSLQLEVQRLTELFSLRNQIGLLGRKETDGAPVLAEAFARLKLA